MTHRDVILFFLGISWAALASRNEILLAFILGAWLFYYLTHTVEKTR